MEKRDSKDATPMDASSRSSGWRGSIPAACLFVLFIALLLSWLGSTSTSHPPAPRTAVTPSTASNAPDAARTHPTQRRLGSQPAITADEIVASKVSQFARDRRRVIHAIALQFKIEEDTNIHLVCPRCSEGLWITGAETLRDVAEAALAHDCDEGEAS